MEQTAFAQKAHILLWKQRIPVDIHGENLNPVLVGLPLNMQNGHNKLYSKKRHNLI